MVNEKFILVIADGSKEMDVALRYACARSKKTNRKIMIATFIEPLDVLTTQGVTEIMQNEAREEAEKRLQYASSVVKESTGILPVLHVKEGEIIQELKNLINDPPYNCSWNKFKKMTNPYELIHLSKKRKNDPNRNNCQ